MANLKDIRIRIDSTKNTQQITKAMKLVSAAKLRKAQHNITNMRPYAVTLKKVIANITATQKVSHPLMTKKDNVKNVLLKSSIVAFHLFSSSPFSSSSSSSPSCCYFIIIIIIQSLSLPFNLLTLEWNV